MGEGATGFNVRGGNIDQNLILLDESPVFSSSHLFGFFSVFNADAIKDAKLYKGGTPSKYGGRLSSVLDIRQKEGNQKKYSATRWTRFTFQQIDIGRAYRQGQSELYRVGSKKPTSTSFSLLPQTRPSRTAGYISMI